MAVIPNPGGNCILSITYTSNYGGGGIGRFNVPSGAYQTGYVYWYGSTPSQGYDVRSDGSADTLILAGPYYPPNNFQINYTEFSNTCPPPSKKYDCINGQCVDSATFKTEGKYSSLAECEADCGVSTNSCTAPNICVSPDYCPPGMVCIESAQWGQIEGLASDVKNKSC